MQQDKTDTFTESKILLSTGVTEILEPEKIKRIMETMRWATSNPNKLIDSFHAASKQIAAFSQWRIDNSRKTESPQNTTDENADKVLEETTAEKEKAVRRLITSLILRERGIDSDNKQDPEDLRKTLEQEALPELVLRLVRYLDQILKTKDAQSQAGKRTHAAGNQEKDDLVKQWMNDTRATDATRYNPKDTDAIQASNLHNWLEVNAPKYRQIQNRTLIKWIKRNRKQ
jgi:hypothetical protein